MPDSLTTIGARVFLRSSLTEVVIPANVTTIGAAAFKNSAALEQITLPASLTSVADDAFSGCAEDAVFTVFVGTYAEQWANAHGYATNVIVPVEALTLSEESVAINKGKTLTLEAVVGPENATSKAVEWLSSDENVATVKNGKIQTKATGPCDITCRATDSSGVKAVCHVEVIQMVTSVTTKAQKLTIPYGSSSTVEMTFKPADATDQSLLWASSDESICTVDAAGVMTAVGSGDCTITATTADGSNKSVKIKVHVPIFDTMETSCTVTQKDGLLVPVDLHGASVKNVSHKASSDKYFLYYLDADGLHIFPIAEGSAKITLTSLLNKNDKAVYTVTVDASALYDTANDETAPLNVIVTLDKSEVTPGESYTMKYHISGGVPPYTIVEASVYGLSSLNIDNNGGGSISTNGLKPSNGSKQFKVQSWGYDKELITLTVLDSAGTIYTGHSNTLEVDALRLYFNSDYYAWPMNEQLDIEYQIEGGSGSYNVVATWSVAADGKYVDVSTEKQTSSDHGTISYTPSSGEQISLSLSVTDKKNKNYIARISTPYIVLTDGWTMVANYDKEVAVGDTMTLRLGISGADTSKIKYSTLSLRQFDPANAWMSEIPEYAVNPYFLTFSSENDGISYAYSFTVPKCETIQLNVVLKDARNSLYCGTVTQVK